MKNIKLSLIFDTIFINLTIFLIFFIWIKFISKNLAISFLISIFITITINFFFFCLKKNKQEKNKYSKRLQQDIDSYALTLLSNSSEENLSFFKKIYENEFIKEIKKKNIILSNINNKKTIVSLNFSQQNLSYEQSLKTISYALSQNITDVIFLCVQVDEKTKINLEKIANANIKIYDKNLMFSQIFSKHNTYPPIKFSFKTDKKIKIKELIKLSLDKKKTKSYFLSGLFIFFCSFFVRYNFYYVIVSSLLFFLALFSYKYAPKTQ